MLIDGSSSRLRTYISASGSHKLLVVCYWFYFFSPLLSKTYFYSMLSPIPYLLSTTPFYTISPYGTGQNCVKWVEYVECLNYPTFMIKRYGLFFRNCLRRCGHCPPAQRSHHQKTLWTGFFLPLRTKCRWSLAQKECRDRSHFERLPAQIIQSCPELTNGKTRFRKNK